MKKAIVYSACVNGTFTQIKAYKRKNAVNRFKELDGNIKSKDVKATNFQNSHQAPVEDLY